MDDLYIEGLRAALRSQSRDSHPQDETAGEWLSGWDFGNEQLERMKQTFILKIIPLGDGTYTAQIYDSRERKVRKVGELNKPVRSGEEAEILAREFRSQYPELFTGKETFLDTADVSEQKNPQLYGDGELESIPENKR